ncbi:EutN/CcmL family microcompartment protein [Pseudothauera rhizosphaerae]|uniref:Ethanolamine utilization microcompartment protein EutN n=1 Tax=Pseudothauera rhizosphaerae TaxID=2565932 RepID=A0A4S4AIW0_9RHOO|nr:EutN/CcmL family microcompartment protein [Pseudothauera rhizosphaerae]THF59307.1 ethanolamine utilization microcompartment protein EutN [Pseudothauera rhizosphaerae]
MQLAVVVGQVVSTVKCSGFQGDRLLLVDFIDEDGKPQGIRHVAADGIGAGTGEWVLIVQGSSARKTLSDEVPVDMSVVGIVDEVVVGERVTYHK